MDLQIRTRTLKSGKVRHQAVIEVWSEGKRQIITVGTFDDHKMAQRKGFVMLSKYESDAEKAAALRANTTLTEWAAEWIESRTGKIKESSRNEYARKLKNWVLPTLGEKRLSELTAMSIRRWVDTLPAKGLSLNSQEQALAVLALCLTGAVKDGALLSNPTQGVKVEMSRSLKAADDADKPMKVWTHEESQKLLEGSEGILDIDAVVVLGLLGGLRPGETEGLKWEDIDFLNSTVTVKRANREATSTKSGKNRTVPLPFEAIRRLMAIQERQVSPTKWGRKNPQAYPWVMTMTIKTGARKLQEICALLKITELPPHSLRHTFASLLISAGVPIPAVSKLLGHSTPAITLTVYSHAMPKDIERATSILEQTLNVAPPPVPQEAPQRVEMPETLMGEGES